MTLREIVVIVVVIFIIVGEWKRRSSIIRARVPGSEAVLRRIREKKEQGYSDIGSAEFYEMAMQDFHALAENARYDDKMRSVLERAVRNHGRILEKSLLADRAAAGGEYVSDDLARAVLDFMAFQRDIVHRGLLEPSALIQLREPPRLKSEGE